MCLFFLPSGSPSSLSSRVRQIGGGSREIQVIVGRPEKVVEADVVKFAKELTKHSCLPFSEGAN
jgi:hypothetical protein